MIEGDGGGSVYYDTHESPYYLSGVWKAQMRLIS